jgi:FixJ family two-component response regulator
MSVAMQLAAGVRCERLTKREAEVMKLVVVGKSNKEIGAALGVTEGTLKVHAGHAFKSRCASAAKNPALLTYLRSPSFLRLLRPENPQWQGLYLLEVRYL